MANETITKPSAVAVSQKAYVIQAAQNGIITVPAQFFSISIYSPDSSGTFTVKVGDNTAQTLNAGTVYTLPYIGKPYEQAVIADGGGSVNIVCTIIY